MKDPNRLSSYWKVPFRQVYCDTFAGWLKSLLWIFVVMKVFPHARDLGGDALVDHYHEDPKAFYDQYRSVLSRVSLERKLHDMKRPNQPVSCS